MKETAPNRNQGLEQVPSFTKLQKLPISSTKTKKAALSPMKNSKVSATRSLIIYWVDMMTVKNFVNKTINFFLGSQKIKDMLKLIQVSKTNNLVDQTNNALDITNSKINKSKLKSQSQFLASQARKSSLYDQSVNQYVKKPQSSLQARKKSINSVSVSMPKHVDTYFNRKKSMGDTSRQNMQVFTGRKSVHIPETVKDFKSHARKKSVPHNLFEKPLNKRPLSSNVFINSRQEPKVASVDLKDLLNYCKSDEKRFYSNKLQKNKQESESRINQVNQKANLSRFKEITKKLNFNNGGTSQQIGELLSLINKQNTKKADYHSFRHHRSTSFDSGQVNFNFSKFIHFSYYLLTIVR